MALALPWAMVGGADRNAGAAFAHSVRRPRENSTVPLVITARKS
jgi:hypothetical protein